MNSDLVWQNIRYVLIGLGGMLVGAGYVTAEQVDLAVGAIVTLGTVTWGVYVRWKTRAVPERVADRPEIPTVSGATGQRSS